MKTLVVTLLLAAGACLAACGGGGSGDGGSVTIQTPGPAAPRDVIAFGAAAADGSNALYLVRSDGTGSQVLAGEVQSVSFPRWSPDGARIAYIVAGGRGPGTEATLRIYDFDGAHSITLSEHALASGDEAPMAWSPDGKRIAFIEVTDGGMLRVYDFDQAKLLDAPAVPATSVAWSSADELAIVALTEDASSTDVYSLAPDDSEADLLFAQDGTEGAPAWSPDGATLTFWGGSATDLSQRTLFIAASGSSSAKGIGPGLDATWSSDERIAYSRPEVPGTRGDLDIYVADGKSEPQRVTQAVTLDRWPSWSPSGDTVVFVGEADASTSFLCVAALNGEENACFDLLGLTPSAPAWSPY